MRFFAVLLVGLCGAGPALADFDALLTAARTGDMAAVTAMLSGGESPNPPEWRQGYAPLQFAAGHGDRAMTTALLEAGADTEYRDHNGERAILWAARRGQSEAVALLLEAGSPPDSALDPHGQSPLLLASSYGGNTETATLLLANGANPNRFDHTGDTPLHLASRYGQVDIVTLLLEAGANPNVIGTILLETPLHEAVERGSGAVVDLLLAAGAAVDPRADDGETPLFLAAYYRNEGIVRSLVAAGADVDVPRDDGTLPIVAALAPRVSGSSERDGTAVALLLAELTAHRDEALVAAAEADAGPVAIRLLELGADPSATKEAGGSALAAAAGLADPDLFRRLLAAGADLSRFGSDALLSAAAYGRDVTLGELIAGGIPVDSRAEVSGATPLMLAAIGGHVETVRFLLKAGADPAPRDNAGNSIEHYMRVRPELIELEIATRGESRALRPTTHLVLELEALAERHSEIVQMLAAWPAAIP